MALLAFAESEGRKQQGELFATSWRNHMERAIDQIAAALAALSKPDPWSADLKTSDEFLDPLFRNFYQRLALPNMMRKTDYHTLAPFVTTDQLEDEVREKLDAIADVAEKARPRGNC